MGRMKKSLLTILFLVVVSNSFCHDFYFSFAEVELDELNGRIEVTIISTTHDIEKELRSENSAVQQIPGNERDSILLSILEQKLNKGFTIQIDEVQQELKLEGIEVMLNGVTQFYLSGELSNAPHQVEVYFGLLMNTFSEQQNKMTILYRGKKKTLVFLPPMPKQTFKLSNDNE